MRRSIGLMIVGVLGCSTKPRVVFHATDPKFSAEPGSVPRGFTEENISEVPKEPMHSVGIIEVTFLQRHLDLAVERAIEKGRELGCWIVVEHGVFLQLRTQASRDGGVTIILVHGGAPHTPSVRPPADVMQFDCVVRGAAAKSASADQRDLKSVTEPGTAPGQARRRTAIGPCTGRPRSRAPSSGDRSRDDRRHPDGR